MTILLWLVPPVVATALAAAWAAWAGRNRPSPADRSDAAQERARQRFAEAIMREHPQAVRRRSVHEHSTGVAVRQRRSA